MFHALLIKLFIHSNPLYPYSVIKNLVLYILFSAFSDYIRMIAVYVKSYIMSICFLMIYRQGVVLKDLEQNRFDLVFLLIKISMGMLMILYEKSGYRWSVYYNKSCKNGSS